MRTGRRTLRRTAAVAAGVPVLLSAAPGHVSASTAAVRTVETAAAAETRTAPPALLPLTVTNRSGRGEQTYVYVLGTNLRTGRLGYVDAAGAFTPWPAGANPPSPAPDVAIPGPAGGSTKSIKLPLDLSGRVYVSFGTKLKFFLTPDGLVQPAPWAAGDPNRDILFDWTEFTYNGSGLWLNTSMVDMFSVPQAVEVTAGDGTRRRTGDLVPNGRERILDAMRNQPGDWAKLIHRRADGTRLRVVSPHKGIDTGVFSPTYMDGYIREAWATYRNTTLTVVPFADQPARKFLGRTDASGVLNFTDASGNRVASFARPSTKDVFGCDGRLQAPNDPVVGPIARTLCAGLHRSTLGYVHTQPTTDASRFYKRTVTDHYSRKLHAHTVDGKAYGFAFDDVGNFESLVHDGSPRSAGITLTPF
ncbi:beta-1,3-glucanase family protein [Planomonospora parontospora]|uniref:beta-1,3-glucanase family protein n=1 Tax=Planomonospora parontospora TaxID=58119 RepID=UPI001670A75A|nr:beta-1,3-glucanase family protein [Planomonospora parontospora]GGL21492.1 hydrolase [Planomonospora parontospora subsp. antibiotica]GII15781.1 hydrolase [Planomonospora parontospora subsp. antibiotica]